MNTQGQFKSLKLVNVTIENHDAMNKLLVAIRTNCRLTTLTLAKM